jgi:hypothetical protein
MTPALSADHIWIEDCGVQPTGHTDGMVFQGGISELFVRNCKILNPTSPSSATQPSLGNGGKCQCMYLSGVQGFIIEDNYLYKAGWITIADKNGFNAEESHGGYAQAYQYSGIVVGNYCAWNSSHGFQVRSGGIDSYNCFVHDSLGTFVQSTPSVMQYNIVEGGESIGPNNPRGFGITDNFCPTCEISFNVFEGKPAPTVNQGPAIEFQPIEPDNAGDYPGGSPVVQDHSQTMAANLHDNKVAVTWDGSGYILDPNTVTHMPTVIPNLNIFNNDWTGATIPATAISIEQYAAAQGFPLALNPDGVMTHEAGMEAAMANNYDTGNYNPAIDPEAINAAVLPTYWP